MRSLLLVIICYILPFSSITQEQEALIRGLELKEEGKYLEALTVWERARGELDSPSLLIGRAHIELATEQKIEDAYEIASTMYTWALTATTASKKDIEIEMKMLEPIVEPRVYKEWRTALKNDSTSVLPLIQQFWSQRDFTPDTPYNERLIEHWERIGHARKEFTRNDNTVYGTDERATTYVEFGEPDLTHKGTFIIDGFNVTNLVVQRIFAIT